MRTTFAVTEYCRASKANKNGESPIELSIIINGKRCFIQLPIRCKATEFKKLLASRKPNPIKDYVFEVHNKLTEIQVDMMKNNIPFTAENLRMYYQNGGVSQNLYTVSKLFDEYIKLIKGRVGVDLTEASFNRYVRAKGYFLDYLGKDLLVEEITPSVMQGYHIYLKSKYMEGTICGILTRTKTVFKFAMDNGNLSVNPFQNLRYGKGKKDIEFLTEEELNRLINLKIENKSLDNVRDCFILQASTGLSYIDLLNLTKEDIRINEDGTHYIVKNRHKTEVEFTTVVLPVGVEVLKKHNYQLRIISNQKYNYMLKLLQEIAGIETKITSHLARKTYGTLLLNKGIRVETVAKMLGHKNVRTTTTYYTKLLTNTVLNEVKAIM